MPVHLTPEEMANMHAACVDALHACMEAIRPGRPTGRVFAAHARVPGRVGSTVG